MNCERYKNALLDAATSSRKLGEKLAHHLDQCPQCRTSLEAERELLSQIDAALRERVNEDPSAGFLPKVRVRISKATPANSGSNSQWVSAGVALAAVLVAALFPMVNHHQANVEGNHIVPTISTVQSAEMREFAHDVHEDSRVRSSKYSGKRSRANDPAPGKPEVLVPLDEQKAFAQFVARVAGRDAMAEAVVSPAANKTAARNTELPQVPSVDISDLQFDQGERDRWMNETGGSE